MNELAERGNEILSALKSSFYPNASEQSIAMVLSYCRAAGLDPMTKPVHIVPMWDRNAKMMRDVIMPGIDLYRTKAARTGQFAGTSEPEFGPDQELTLGGQKFVVPTWCKVTVKRAIGDGIIAEFTAIERWMENYATAKNDTDLPNAMWKKRPYGQLAKCAEAQALRKAFPEHTQGPVAEEMEGKEITVETQLSKEDLLEQAVLKHKDTINVIKEGIASGDLSKASEAWFELTNDEKESIWVAPTKFANAPFTTEERAIMKTPEFRKAHTGVEQ